MQSTQESKVPSMTTLSECIANALEHGYVENFKVLAKGLATEDEKFVYIPQDIEIPNFYRFEGASDPQDNSILYLIKTNDGRKGTLIDAYGTYADTLLSNFIRQVEVIQKAHKS